MKVYILLFFFMILYLNAYGQIVKGIILDRETKSAIPFATVYFDGTSVGTTSDEEGSFALDIRGYNLMPLSISAVGYSSFRLADFSSDDSYLIYLTPQVYEIQEVSVGAKSLIRERRKNLKLFRKEFIGSSKNAAKCKIINEEDITFNYGSDVDTLKAIALNPIQIYNGALGYQSTYFLDNFEYDKKNKITSYDGNVLLKKDLAYGINKTSYARRRRKAYYGSQMHFFRALWADALRSNSFIIRNSAGKKLKYKDVVISGDTNRKYMKYPENLQVYYKSELSSISFLKEQNLFGENGFFDGKGILWTGKMTINRMADWLPYDFEPSNDKH